MKTTSQLFHRHLLVSIIAIVLAIAPIQTQALSLSQLQTGLLILLLSNRSYTNIQAPYRGYSVGDTFNTFYDPYRTYSPFTSYSSFNMNSSCGFTNLMSPSIRSLFPC